MYETIKISQLPGLSSPSPTDLIPVVSGGETQATTPGSLSADWRDLDIAPSVITNYGQRQHLIQYTGVDYSGNIGPGSKLRIPRVGSTPTMCADFESSSSQYASRASPTNITFTDDYTTTLWMKPESYGVTQAFLSRRQSGGTTGFELRLNNVGQAETVALNGASVRVWTSAQSVPLGRWTHIAITTNISAGSYSVYFDGIETLGSLTNNTGAMTALVQSPAATAIELGSTQGGTSNFDGMLSEVTLWNVVRSATDIRDNMNKQLTGTETNLIGYWKLDGNFNDATGNNNLTGSGGAVATTVDNPFSAIEYAIVTNVVYSGGNTSVTIFTGQNTLPNDTIGFTSYSGLRAPYGFPSSRNRWRIVALSQVSAGNAASSWANLGSLFITVPVGSWRLGYVVELSITTATTPVPGGAYIVLSQSATTPSNPTRQNHIYSDKIYVIQEMVARESAVDLAAATPYYLIALRDGTGVTSVGLRGDVTPSEIYAECAYL